MLESRKLKGIHRIVDVVIVLVVVVVEIVIVVVLVVLWNNEASLYVYPRTYFIS